MDHSAHKILIGTMGKNAIWRVHYSLHLLKSQNKMSRVALKVQSRNVRIYARLQKSPGDAHAWTRTKIASIIISNFLYYKKLTYDHTINFFFCHIKLVRLTSARLLLNCVRKKLKHLRTLRSFRCDLISHQFVIYFSSSDFEPD